MLTWVIGAGGLLGSAISARCGDRWVGTPIDWKHRDSRLADLSALTHDFRIAAGDSPWCLIWAAGSGVVSSGSDALEGEIESLEVVLAALSQHPPSGRGVIFLASSAGGVYAGSVNPPFTSETEVRPISAYGELKLRQEKLSRDLRPPNASLVIGRYSNIYGPRQNLEKPQGLINHLCVAAARRSALNLYVPMETLRDYIYADDAARLTMKLIHASAIAHSSSIEVAVIATGQSTSVAQLLGITERVTHRRIPVATSATADSARQTVDLRLVPHEVALAPGVLHVGLATGIRRVFDSLVAMPLPGGA